MIVVDSSVLVAALVEQDIRGERATQRLADDPDVHVPHLVDLEVVSSLRSMLARGQLTRQDAEVALADFDQSPMTRYVHGPFLGRVWQLRDNLSPYDAVYVALAEALDVALVTGDARLAAAPGVDCPVEVVTA